MNRKTIISRFRERIPMNNPRNPFFSLLLTAYLASATPLPALITGAFGNDPVEDMGWPAGSVAVANHADRIGYWEGPPFGGGEYHFLFNLKNAESLEALIQAFSEITAPVKEIILRDESLSSFWLSAKSRESAEMNAELVLWKPESWNWLNNNPRNLFLSESPGFRSPCPPPRLILSTTAFPTFPWKELPASCTVIDQCWGGDTATRSLKVQVLDMTDHKPVANARVVARQYSTGPEITFESRADSDGIAMITGLSRGSYRILVTADQFAGRMIAAFPQYRDLNENLIVYLSQSASIQGTVMNSEEEPVPGAMVRLVGWVGMDGQPYPMGESPNCTTDATGSFQLDGLPHGYAQAIALHQDYEPLKGMEEIFAVPGKAVSLVLIRKTGNPSALGTD
jgi:hypothetical protein